MAAKSEAAPPAAVVTEPAAAPAKGGGMVPLIAVLVLAPALSWGVAQFVLLPQLKKELSAPAGAGAADEPAAESAKPAKAEKPAKEEKGGHGKKGEGAAAAGNTYKFENIVVNLAGTMGTRYLKTTFLVTGANASLAGQFEAARPQLLDVTLNVLSSLSLADLEEAGAKNLIREKLIVSYNQVFGKRVAEQIYFSDFVVQ